MELHVSCELDSNPRCYNYRGTSSEGECKWTSIKVSLQTCDFTHEWHHIIPYLHAEDNLLGTRRELTTWKRDRLFRFV